MGRFVVSSRGIGELGSDGLVRLLKTRVRALDEWLARGCELRQLSDLETVEVVPVDDLDLLSPVASPSAVWAQGLAYKDHATEMARTPSPAPRVFLVAPSALIGHGAEIKVPERARYEVDYEGELAVVISSAPPENLALGRAWDHVAGVTCCNDVSARDVQRGEFEGKVYPTLASPTLAKSFETFKPLGPCVVTVDELAEPDDLGLRTWVDGELRQSARTSEMLFSIPELVHYVAWHARLRPGDVILTGTPSGVGAADGSFLVPGSEVAVEVEGVGVLRNRVAVKP